MAEAFWRAWWFTLPNYVLALVMYTLLGRFVLSLFVPAGWQNYIWRAFVRLTQPALVAIGFITPRIMHGLILPLIAAFWMLLLRLAYFLALSAAGAPPTVG